MSDFTKSKFDERFQEMEKAGDVYLKHNYVHAEIYDKIYNIFLTFIIYYILVCEDKKRNRLCAAGTVVVEKKFVRGAGLV